MYVYFDENGTLKEIVSDKKFRVGDSKRDKIYVYWDGEHAPASGWIKYRKPDGTEYPESVEECFFQLGDNLVGKALPEKPLRNLKYFSYDHTYEENGEQKAGYLFYEITVPDEVLNSSFTEGEVPNENNMVIARIRFVLNEGERDGLDEFDAIATMGAVVFSVETNIGILTDSSIDLTQYNYLIKLISTKIGYGIDSVKVDELPKSGEADVIYYVASAQNPLIYDVYFWNGDNFVYLGTTAYGLYTKQEGEEFEIAIQTLWTAELDDYKALMNTNFNEYKSLVDSRLNAMETSIVNLESGSPKGVFSTLTALTNAYPSGTSGIFVVKDNGHWYYWNGTEWEDGGQYLSGVQDYDGALNSASANAVQNKVLQPLFTSKEERYYSGTKYNSDSYSSTFNGWLVAFSKKICNGVFKSIKVVFSLSPATTTVKCILMDANKVVLKEVSKTCVSGNEETFTLNWDLNEVTTENYCIGFIASANEETHMAIYSYQENFRNDDYIGIAKTIETAYTVNKGNSWSWMGNTSNMSFKNFWFDAQIINYKQAPAKEDTATKAEFADYSSNAVLGKENHENVNLFDKNACSPAGQWCAWNTGKFEYYPANQYIQLYCNSDYIEVKGGEDYVFTGGNTAAGWQENEGIAWFDEDKIYISGEKGGQFHVDGKLYHAPDNAKYCVISFSKRSYIEIDVQFAKGTAPTPYQPYYGNLYYLNNLKVKADQIEGATANKQYFKCADAYDLVVGDSFELFYKGILEVFNYEEYNVLCQCDIGKCLTRKFAVPNITNAMVGNHSLKMTLYSNDGVQLDQKTITLRVAAKATSPVGEKVILCMGDSLTQGGQWPDEFGRRLTKTTSQTTWGAAAPQGLGLANITFIGKKTSAGGIKYEGYGGWTFADYLSAASSTMYWLTATGNQKTASDQESIWEDANGVQWQLETIETNRLKFKKYSGTGIMPSSGILTWVSGGSNTSDIAFTASSIAEGNPFVYNGQIDFSAYCADMGVSTINEVYILLGWNNATAANPPSMEKCKQFIDLLRAFNPNVKVVLMGLQIPSQEGCGQNYGATGIYSKYMTLVKYVHNLDDAYKSVAEEYASGVYSVNLAGQFDTEYNMEFSDTTPNSRNPLTISLQSNGVHPAIGGYYQIADVAYRWFNQNN